MKISEFSVRKSSLVEPVSIQLKSALQDPQDKLSDQQDTLSQILTGLGMKYTRCGNNISVSRIDYLWLKQNSLATPVVYQRSKLELNHPVLIYILRNQRKTGENEFLDLRYVIDRLEEIGLFYALPKEAELSLYVLIEKNSVIKFRKWNLQQHQEHTGVFFPAANRL